MSAIKPLPDYQINLPEDPTKCPECYGPLRAWAIESFTGREGSRAKCSSCGWTRDDWGESDEDGVLL